MGAALATTVSENTITRRRTARTEEMTAGGGFAAPVSLDGEGRGEPMPDPDLDGGLVAAVGEMLRMQREDAASALSERLSGEGVDANVCAFLEDDLREAADALADTEAYFQETIEALGASAPSPKVLIERAADAGILERVDHLHQVLSNMRRRLVQVSAGLSHAKRRR